MKWGSALVTGVTIACLLPVFMLAWGVAVGVLGAVEVVGWLFKRQEG